MPTIKATQNKPKSSTFDEFDSGVSVHADDYKPQQMRMTQSNPDKLRALKQNEYIHDMQILTTRELRDIPAIKRLANQKWGPVIARAKDGVKEFAMQTTLCIFPDGKTGLITLITRTE